MGKSAQKWALTGLFAVGVGSLVLLNVVAAPAYLREQRAGAPGQTDDARRKGTAAPAAATDAPTVIASAAPTKHNEPVATAARPESAPSPVVTKEQPASPPSTTDERPSASGPAAGPGAVPIASVPAPQLGNAASTIYFETRSSGLGAAERRALWQVGQQMLADPSRRLRLHGHADERGDPAFNDWLAERRAQVAAAFLVSMGVSPSRIVTSSHGASSPADESGSNDALARNRRVELAWAQ